MKTFHCDRCGRCCAYVGLSTTTNFLNRGDGVCKCYDEEAHRCKVYEIRPMFCRVEEYYLSSCRSLYTWDEYVSLTKEACKKLQLTVS